MLIVIAQGYVELYTYCEGNKFVLEILGPGSVINHHNVLLDDPVYVNAQCLTNCNLLILPENKLWRISGNLPKFNQKLKLY